jgi:glycine/D-amino acid oxidase-like deaminating enzyme
MNQQPQSVATTECDFLVIGSGAGALTAAITAGMAGLKVLIVEKEPLFGGASARSGGGVWIPGSSKASKAGRSDSRAEMITYFKHEAQDRYDEKRVCAFLDEGPRMLKFLEDNSPIRFFLLDGFPDYYPDHPGGSANARSLGILAVDGRKLGPEIKRLRPPMAISHIMGMMIGLEDYIHYMRAGQSMTSFLYVAKLLLRLFRDKLFHGRSMRLGGGNAIVGSLAAKVFELGIPLWTSSPARSLIRENGGISGAVVETGGGFVRVLARRGVLLATGGFPHDTARRAKLFPMGARSAEMWALMPYGNTGDGIRMGEEVGGVFDERMPMPIALSPISRLALKEGQLATFPVFGSRGGPGVIAVTRRGVRFTDEARSYHSFGKALLEACKGEAEAVGFLICDKRALRRYGLGYAHPFPLPVRRHLRSGYVLTADNLQRLAEKAGIDAHALVATVEEYNRAAREGSDPRFGRGLNAYDLAAGDPTHAPNPCVGPLEGPPYFALRVVPGSVGTFAGLMTDENARVLDKQSSAIPGLYATGNDLSSITGGDYIGGGCTIGPAMTFGYIAAKHVAGKT